MVIRSHSWHLVLITYNIFFGPYECISLEIKSNMYIQTNMWLDDHMSHKLGWRLDFIAFLRIWSRLYIDRLAHWRSLLVDLILKFEPLALVSQCNFAITINWIMQPFNLKSVKKLFCINGIQTPNLGITKPRPCHWATTDSW